MENILKNTNLQSKLVKILLFVSVFGVISNYFFVFYSLDINLTSSIPYVKIITHIPLFIASVFALLFSVENKKAKTVWIAVAAISFLSCADSLFRIFLLAESFGGTLARVFPIGIQVLGAYFSFWTLNFSPEGKVVIRKIWYILLCCLILGVPFCYIAYCNLSSAFDWNLFYDINVYIFIFKLLQISCMLISLSAIVANVYFVKKNKNAAFFSLKTAPQFFFALSVFVCAFINFLSIAQIDIVQDYVQYKDYAIILSEACLLLIAVSVLPKEDTNKKRKKH